MNEFELIRQYFQRPLAEGTGVRVGIGDDGAICKPPAGHELVITTDMLVAGVHFPDGTSARAIGHKSLAVNLSDLAAMGARPAWFTLSLSLPSVDTAWLAEFAQGLHALAQIHGITLVGGDTVKGPLVMSIQACGFIPIGGGLLRTGASPGDQIFVTGTLGDAALELMHLRSQNKPIQSGAHPNLEKLNYPCPRVAEGMSILSLASAAIDISDGLCSDLGHILQASDVGARIELESLPLSGKYKKSLDETGWDLALYGGDDYELCFTVPADRVAELQLIAQEWSCPLTHIGIIESTPGMRIFDRDGKQVIGKNGGYDHFRSAGENEKKYNN